MVAYGDSSREDDDTSEYYQAEERANHGHAGSLARALSLRQFEFLAESNLQGFCWTAIQ